MLILFKPDFQQRGQNVEYPFIAITPSSMLTWSGSAG